MRYLLIMIAMLGFNAMPALAQNDTAAVGQSEYSCAFTTPTTLACVKGDVDQNQDGMLDSDEWAQVPDDDRAIIDLENQFEEGTQPGTEQPESPIYREDRQQQQQSDEMESGEGTFNQDRETQNQGDRAQDMENRRFPANPEGSGRNTDSPGNDDMNSGSNY